MSVGLEGGHYSWGFWTILASQHVFSDVVNSIVELFVKLVSVIDVGNIKISYI